MQFSVSDSGRPESKKMITVSIMLATVMQALDTTIANVALPNMQGGMSATQDQISWVLTSYIVAAAIMTPLAGVLAAKYGRKQIFLLSVIGFTLTSMCCGAANSLVAMVVFRILQGIFGASLIPLSQAVLLDTYPRKQHGSAMAIWGIGVMVGPILGPTLGGYLTEMFSWRWVFYINLPVGILTVLGIMSFVPETEKEPDRRFDYFGFTLLSISIGALQLFLDRGQSLDWFSSREIVVEAVLAGLFFYLFLVHMFTSCNPFINPAIFKDRNFAVGITLIFMVGTTLYATLTLLPPFMQQLMGFPVITTGFVLAPRGAGTMLAMFFVGKLVGRVDTRLLIFSGLCMTALALSQMAKFTIQTPISLMVYTGLLQGFGFGFVFVPLSTTSFSTLRRRYRTEATALYSLMRNIGSSIGISVVVTMLARNIQINHASLTEYITPFREVLSPQNLPAVYDPSTVQGVILLNNELIKQAGNIAYLNDFLLVTWVTLASTPLLLLIKPKAKTL